MNTPRRRLTPQRLWAALACATPLLAGAGGPAGSLGPAHLPAQETTDRLIVQYRDAKTAVAMKAGTLTSAQGVAAKRGYSVRHLRSTSLGAQVLQLNRAVSVTEAQAMAQDIAASDFNVEYAEPDRRLHALFTPNDPGFAQQFHYFEAAGGINAPLAWDKARGAGVVVAVIDTGARPHADLAANLVSGFDFITSAAIAGDGNGRDADGTDPGDFTAAGECGPGTPASRSSWHGTHVAGTIAAVTNNGSGVAGVAFNAKVQPVRALGKCGGATSDIADAIVWASGGSVTGAPANATPARVINMSLGGSGACSRTTQAAINSARSRGTVVVVAAGNEAQNVANSQPANCTGVVAVAAVGRAGRRASYSNFGNLVDLAAPGGDGNDFVLSTVDVGTTVPAGDGFAGFLGTSMATPHVAAVAALMLSVNPALTPDAIEARLKSSARAFAANACNGCGAGLLDANAAVLAALADANTTPPAPTVTEIAEVEPNNSRATAQVISANPARVNGKVAVGAIDAFRVALPAGARLTAKLTPPATANLDLAIFNVNGALVARATNAGNGTVEQLTVTNSGSAATTVFVRVNGVSATVSGEQAYTLDLSQ